MRQSIHAFTLQNFTFSRAHLEDSPSSGRKDTGLVWLMLSMLSTKQLHQRTFNCSVTDYQSFEKRKVYSFMVSTYKCPCEGLLESHCTHARDMNSHRSFSSSWDSVLRRNPRYFVDALSPHKHGCRPIVRLIIISVLLLVA